MSMRPIEKRLGPLVTLAGLLLFLLRSVSVARSSPAALAGSFDPSGTWSLPVSVAAAILSPPVAGVVGFLLAAAAVLGLGWAARRLARHAGAGERVLLVAGLVPGLLLPVQSPLGRLAPVLLAAFALAGLASAVGAHLERGGALVLLEVMLWSDLLMLCSPDWTWVALALCAALLPLIAGRGRGRVEAPLAVLVAGGAWALVLRLLLEGGLHISDRPPLGEVDPWAAAVLGTCAGLVLVVALLLLVTGRADYGLTVSLAVTGLVALIDLVVPGISAAAGLSVLAVLPALGTLAWRGFLRSSADSSIVGSER